MHALDLATPSSPSPQTSLIFEFPDELILSILSCISPDSQAIGYYARFCAQYNLDINHFHRQREQFLLALSMTCKAMRLRLLPWTWEWVEAPQQLNRGTDGDFERKFNAMVSTLHADVSVAARVKFMMVHLPWNEATIPLFVKCLESLPNLHTLEIGSKERVSEEGTTMTPLLKNALTCVELTQIKTLIIPPTAHPLLQHCCNVEDLVCVARYEPKSDEFLGSFASIQYSKVERLAIPLVLWANPSRFVVACPKLTELTLIYPRLGFSFNPAKSAHSVTPELISACMALPNFETLQIVHFPVGTLPIYEYMGRWRMGVTMEEQKRRLTNEVNDLRDYVRSRFMEAKAGCQDGVGRKETTLRVIELSPHCPDPGFRMSSVEIEEYDV